MTISSEWKKWIAQRDRHAAEVIRREVLHKQRRALVIYGEGHLWRVPLLETITSLLEETTETKVFNVAFPLPAPGSSDSMEKVQPDSVGWRVPAIALLRGTALGAAAFGFYAPPPMMMVFDKVIPLTAEQRRVFELKMEDQFDALLYLGLPATITIAPLPPARCAEPEYMAMRLRRLALVPSPFSQAQVDSLKAYCATHAER